MNSWIINYVELIKQHEKTRCSWVEREKNLRALRARLLTDELVRRAAYNWR